MSVTPTSTPAAAAEIPWAAIIDLARIVLPSLITLLAVALTYGFATRQARYQKGLEFLNRQIVEFYSPLVGAIKRIRALSELRVELHDAAGDAWQKICASAPQPFLDSEERFKPFDALINYDNEQLYEQILPLYDRLVSVFTEHYWLAEDSTKTYYLSLCRFVEIWHRFKKRTIPKEVLRQIKHKEAVLHPFYEDLERHLRRLTSLVANRKSV